MKHKIFGFVIASILLIMPFTWTASAEAPTEPPAPPKTSWTVDEVKVLVDQYADRYSVSRTTMHSVVNCESSYDYNIVGDQGRSHGLAQIFGPANPDISIEEANNPDFALDFMASNISKGRGSKWTCYRNLKK